MTDTPKKKRKFKFGTSKKYDLNSKKIMDFQS